MVTISKTDAKILMDTVTQAIKSTCAKYGRPAIPADVADMAGDAYIKFLENFNPDKGAVAALAYVTGRTVALDFLRNRGHKRIAADETSLTDDSEDGDSGTVDLVSHTPNPRDALIMKRRVEAVERAMSERSAEECEALLPDENMALNGTVRQRRLRAIDRIQEDVSSAA